MNKKSLGALAATAIILSQALMSAAPSTAAAPVITNTTTTTRNAFAAFSHTDGCIRTDIFVDSGQVLDDAISGGIAIIQQFDTCAGQVLIDISTSNGRPGGGTAGVGLVVQKSLSGATLRMFSVAENFVTGISVPVTVDVSFEATAKASRSTSRNVFLDQGRRITSTTVTETRLAVATATVTVGTEVVLDPSTSSTTGGIPALITESTVRDSVKDSSGL